MKLLIEMTLPFIFLVYLCFSLIYTYIRINVVLIGDKDSIGTGAVND